jgi:hypothetical protein
MGPWGPFTEMYAALQVGAIRHEAAKESSKEEHSPERDGEKKEPARQ